MYNPLRSVAERLAKAAYCFSFSPIDLPVLRSHLVDDCIRGMVQSDLGLGRVTGDVNYLASALPDERAAEGGPLSDVEVGVEQWHDNIISCSWNYRCTS